MKKYYFIIILLFLLHIDVAAQASYSTSIAFRLYDKNKQIVDLEQFKKEYQIANAFGNIVEEQYFDSYIQYDSDSNYFIIDVNTIGPRFSFALYHEDTIMTIFLPFNRERSAIKKYAIDLSLKEGDYLINYKVREKNKIYLNSNIPFFRKKTLSWNKMKRKFLRSEYRGQELIYRQ